MTNLALAALVFAVMHLFISGTTLRDVLIARLGANVYRAAFSIASIAALWWLIQAWVGMRTPQVTALVGVRALAALLMLVAFALVVLGLTTPGPTSVGGERLLDQDDNARGVHRITRHPFLWGVALWAAVHLVFNPEPANLLFFGCFLVVAGYGTFSIDGKRARQFGERWAPYAAKTSNLPFVAVAQGRNKLALGEIGLWRWLIVLAVFGAFAHFHARFFGLPPL
ncbi:MAG TPA: NnrU family protein [Verrucomicrobiae bacterium]|nr:NnrU family protein [Verrucomicrobiae bacterium]